MRIQQARRERGWSWNGEDDSCFVAASRLLEPGGVWCSGGPYAYGISLGTWKRFLAGKAAINAQTFKAYCQVLGLNWEEVVDRQGDAWTGTQQDWDEAIDVAQFCGREQELAQLEHWIGSDRCRLVMLSGMGGIGKTTLSVQLAQRLGGNFEFVLRRSLRRAPSLELLLHECNTFLGHPSVHPPINPLTHLLETLRQCRCLVLLDDVETILCSGELSGQYQSHYQNYHELFRRLAQESHQSCILVITREKLRDLASLAGDTLPVRDFRLGGLELQAAHQILATKGFLPHTPGSHELIRLYRGHPLALKLMATTIQEIFGGQVDEFLSQSTLVLGDIMPSIFHQQLQRLSRSESIIINWLALANRPITFNHLRQYLRFSSISTSEIVAALESIKRRSLLEVIPSDTNTPWFSIEPVLMKYVISQLAEQFCREIMQLLSDPSEKKLMILKMYCLVEQHEHGTVSLRPWIINRLQDYLSSCIPDLIQHQQWILTLCKELELKSAKELGYTLQNLKYLLPQLNTHPG